MNLSIRTENEKLKMVMGAVNSSATLQTYLKCSNVTAIDRLGYNDHGPVHVRIVAKKALKILGILTENGIVPSCVRDHGLTEEDSEVIVYLASILHDIGHAISRDDHENLAIIIALPLLNGLLKGVYGNETRTIVISEVCHAIKSHEYSSNPLTLEAGIVKIADALDMEEGRARIPFLKGSVSIHSISALSIKKVRIREGKDDEKLIVIEIEMMNSAGIFQIDDLLEEKLKHSGLEDYVSIYAKVVGEERSILKEYRA